MKLLSFLIFLLLSTSALAVEKVGVVALFKDKAMLSIDGKRKVMSKGETVRGVRLLSVNTYQSTATVEFNGRKETLKLGSAVNASYKKPSHTQVRVLRDNMGSYRTGGIINGRSVSFIVDTGANIIAMSGDTAKRLLIPFEKEKRIIMVQTASGNVKGKLVKLKQVKVGGIELNNIDSVIIPGSSPAQPLLGMNFLAQLEITHQGSLMILKKKY